MMTSRKHLLAAALLAAFGAIAVAQTAAPQAPAAPAERAEMHAHRGADRAKLHERMQQRMERRMAALKLKLQLTPQQQDAWNTWTAAMRPAGKPQRIDRAELRRLTTPERIDRLRQLRAERAAAMDRRGEATKAFYAQLNADQQKVFDLETARFFKGGKHGFHRHGRD